MLNTKLIRQNLAEVALHLARRGLTLDTSKLTNLEEQRKAVQVEAESLQAERNQKSKDIANCRQQGTDSAPLVAEVHRIAERLSQAEAQLAEVQRQLEEILLATPNIPHASVPNGKNEQDNVEVSRWGTPRTFHFTPKDHVDLGQQRGWLDFEAAAKISSARFVVMHADLVRLQRALINFMMDVHRDQHGYEEVYVPYLVNEASLIGTTQLPKFSEDLFHTNYNGLSLISTAEIPVTNLVRDMILEEADLPKRFVCHTPCFRSEAGSYGKDTRGIIRQHQFEKVELVQICKPADSYRLHEELTRHAATILEMLELPYRIVNLCSGDLGFASAKTYDLEVWIPTQNKYREISSCSCFEDFQARRLQARYRDKTTKKIELVHTLNGSGLAVGRTLVAILENFQTSEGKIEVPKVLQPYLGGKAIL